jgi:hypothetical protein
VLIDDLAEGDGVACVKTGEQLRCSKRHLPIIGVPAL